MPAISFSTMKDKILSKEKTQTIRPKRSDYWLQWKEGDRLVGYWEMRSPGESEKLFDSEFAEDPFITTPEEWTIELARRDGFRPKRVYHMIYKDIVEQNALYSMKDWFWGKYGEGYSDLEYVVIRWEDNGTPRN